MSFLHKSPLPLFFITLCGITEDVKTQSSALSLSLPYNHGQFINMICPFYLLNILILHLLFSLLTVPSPSQTTITTHLDYCSMLLNVSVQLLQTKAECCFQNPNLNMSFLCSKPFNNLVVVFGIVVKNA